jgi:uncharacterized protein YukE
MESIQYEGLLGIMSEINKKLDKKADIKVEQVQVDMTAVNSLMERLENTIEEVRKPAKVEHQHRHTIDIGSSKVFLSLVIMALIITGLSYVVGEQRRSISQYKDNDLKYRYIKMQGQTNEEDIYRLEQQFRYSDSIKIIHKQVGKYEELIKEQAEKLERIKRNNEEAEMLQNDLNRLKNRNID